VQLNEWPNELAPADAVYATRWQTTGTSKADVHWRDHFRAFQVTEAMMKRRAKPESVFMHDLPAVRGEDCESIVLDGAQSIAFEQATQKMHTATAILEWAL
jgi:ornithine carbamoyltransferase